MGKKVATLLAYDSFFLDSSCLFVIYGDLEVIGDSTVSSGMELLIECNPTFKISNVIHSIEFIRKEDKEYTAICIYCEEYEDRDILLALRIGDETCEIYDT